MKIRVLMAIMAMVIVFPLVGYTQEGLPVSGKYEIEDKGPVLIGDFKVVEVSNDEVVIKIPFPNPDKANPVEGWQIYASQAWTEGQVWHLVSQDDYSVKTGFEEGLIATIPLLNKGNWHWIRIWGSKGVNEWLPIKMDDPHVRNDTQGNPAYEVLVNNKTQKNQTVPEDYSTRK